MNEFRELCVKLEGFPYYIQKLASRRRLIQEYVSEEAAKGTPVRTIAQDLDMSLVTVSKIIKELRTV
jgi:CRP-like cAMP-binding protein